MKLHRPGRSTYPAKVEYKMERNFLAFNRITTSRPHMGDRNSVLNNGQSSNLNFTPNPTHIDLVLDNMSMENDTFMESWI